MRLLISFASLFLSVALLQFSSGGVGPLDALNGLNAGFTVGQVGFLGSAHFFGFFIGCWWAPRLMGSVGHSRAYATFTAMGAIGLAAHVLVTDPAVDSPFENVELHELLGRSDVLFPLAPGGDATTGLIGAAQIEAMRRGAVLVNVSRGEVLDEDAIVAALDSGQLSGVGLDVGQAADQRPSPLLAGRPDVVATPHLGGLTPENADAQAASSVDQIEAMIAGEMPPRSVNPDDATRLLAWWNR